MDPMQFETSGVRVVKLICNRGEGEWSFALLRNSANQEYYGMRWNGEEGENGYPTSRGKPVWFSLPEEVSNALLAHLKNEH